MDREMVARILIDNNTRNELVPEWGLAALISYRGHSLLLDTGASEKFAANARAMGFDLGQVEWGILSHAHYDHSDGLSAFFENNSSAPFYIRKGAGENCYARDRFFYRYIGIHRGYLRDYEDRIRYVDGDFEICPGVTLIPHKTPGLDKIGKKAKMYVRRGLFWHPDSFDHEQSLVIETKKGLVVFNSCSHGGADNIIRETEKTWPGKRIYALIGGLHLFRSSDEEVRALALRVKETGIEKLYTGHCTGQRALEILRGELGDRVEALYTGLEIVV